MSEEHKAYQANPHGTLIEQIKNSNIPKNEREWAAAREIERLESALAESRQDAANLRGVLKHYEKSVPDAYRDLIQEVERLRKALEKSGRHEPLCGRLRGGKDDCTCGLDEDLYPTPAEGRKP